MRFAFSEEQEELREVVRLLLDRRGGPAVGEPEEVAEGFDREVWSQLAEQVGAHSLGIPEEFGGAGFSQLETLIVVEELGRRLSDIPFLSSAVLAAEALLATGDADACGRLLPGIASGETIAALAWAEPDNGWRTSGFSTTATDDRRLTGRKVHVLDGAQADVLLVLATRDGEPALFETDAAAAVATTPLDPTRRMAEVHLDDAPARPVGTLPVQRLVDVAAAAVAAESVGAAQRWLHETVEYTKMRTQFGRPIGSFQALKHRLADCYVAVESARSLSYAASWAVSTRDERAGELAAMAKSACTEAYYAIAAEGVQLHGGIGITWEHEAHLHLKRAHSATQLFGTPSAHRATLLSA
ncbi:acyl-CoA dehydrogenase family protein [Saccharopolyspora sp. TS4A08]|uniref:Acyl-CoA dehydrogenase family protein n=1 Tax=Saccharopolyspora ipomoeae TaxID=3042027 RepID=A0ABT6PQ24_9PSEU|nr:acyl-CoA dehydrogenase family protein [Saccharopolyspora sp. TS4A08]MDI2029753.1 acyl-CoA dehydrogenase family protein [Saccharopolyspora sp. TS4A08]